MRTMLLAFDGSSDRLAIPDRAKEFGMELDGRDVYPSAQYTELNYVTGAWVDLKCRVTSPMVFRSRIYFHATLVQSTQRCMEDFDPAKHNANTVAIPVPTIPRLEYNTETQRENMMYRLWIDLMRPVFKIEQGAKFSDVTRVNDYTLSINKKDPSNAGDTVFVMEPFKDIPMLYRVRTSHETADARVIELVHTIATDPLPQHIHSAGWVFPDSTSVYRTNARVRSLLRQYDELDQIEPPRFGGVCGSVQPIHLLFESELQYVTIMTANTKLIVDCEFFNRRQWLGGDDVEMRVGYFNNDDDYNEVKNKVPPNTSRLEVIYRHPVDPRDRFWTPVWSQVIGQFIVEASDPYMQSIYVCLT